MKRENKSIGYDIDSDLPISSFGLALIKEEGTDIQFDEKIAEKMRRGPYETIYVERPVPIAIEAYIHDLIDYEIMKYEKSLDRKSLNSKGLTTDASKET